MAKVPARILDRVVTRRRLLGGLALAGLVAPAVIGRAQTPRVVRLGHTEALTGPSAAYGLRGRDGAQFAADEINAAGGFADTRGTLYKVEITDHDMANDARQAITLFRQQALDTAVVAALGPTNSVGFVAVVPVSAQLSLPLIGGGGAPIKTWSPWAYRINPVSATATPILLRRVCAQNAVKRLAIIYDQTQEGQAGDGVVCRQMQGELGYQVVADEAFRAGEQDLSPQVSKIRAAKPDAIYVAGATGDGIKVVSQLRDAGLDQPLLTGYGSFQDPVYWQGTAGRIKGCYTYLSLATATGVLGDWLKRYNARFKLEATSFSAYGYDSVYAVVEAVKRSNGTDRGPVREVLGGLDYRSPIETSIGFRNPPHGDNLTPSVSVVQVTGSGSYVTL